MPKLGSDGWGAPSVTMGSRKTADFFAREAKKLGYAKKSAVLRDPMVTDGAPQPSDPSFGKSKKLFGYSTTLSLPIHS